MSGDWNEYAAVEVTHTCDGVREMLESGGVPEELCAKPVTIGLQCFAESNSRRINTMAIHARMLFKQFGCDCPGGGFDCTIENVAP